MELKEFWNKAIEFYCTYNDPKRLTYFETVFIAISEDSLERVKEKYIKEGGLLEEEIQVLKNKIENSGGVNDSYYTAIREVHNSLNYPEKYSFLRFSILVVGAFKLDKSALRNYWKDFNPFLESKDINVINNRTDYINKLIFNLGKLCNIRYKKTFFQLNIFGENSNIVNVGRIKAHSVFQGSTLKKIKKSIYNLGYSDSHNIADLTINDIKIILEDSNSERILNLFHRDEETKEIVSVCLKIWLEIWIPNQKEKVELLEGKTPEIKSAVQIFRIWVISNENDIEIKYGFNLRSELGEDNVFYLNKNKNIYVDVAWGIKLNENRILYIVENYNNNVCLNENELGFNFNNCDLELNKPEYALEKIPNRMYFIEQGKNNVKIQENPILLATKSIINNDKSIYFHKYKIRGQQDLVFNLYRIIDSFDYQAISFIKTTKLDIYPIGITDGRPGIKSFLSNFPIILKWDNLSKGQIHIFQDDEIFINVNLSEESNNLECSKDIGILKPGIYLIKYTYETTQYEIFINGKDSIDFEIVETGSKDRRKELKIDIHSIFNYHEFKTIKEIVNIENSCLILYDFDSYLKFKDAHTFFYFSKSEENEWYIERKKQYFFLQRLKEKLPGINEIYDNYRIDLRYLSKNFVNYKYKISYCKRSEIVDLNFNINDFYQSKGDHRIVENKIKMYCYYFKLEEMEDVLKNKYPDVNVGDVIYIISNKSEPKAEKLLKLLNQEVFPFKKIKNE
jgi:hypothetical protein